MNPNTIHQRVANEPIGLFLTQINQTLPLVHKFEIKKDKLGALSVLLDLYS